MENEPQLKNGIWDEDLNNHPGKEWSL